MVKKRSRARKPRRRHQCHSKRSTSSTGVPFRAACWIRGVRPAKVSCSSGLRTTGSCERVMVGSPVEVIAAVTPCLPPGGPFVYPLDLRKRNLCIRLSNGGTAVTPKSCREEEKIGEAAEPSGDQQPKLANSS